MTTDRPSADATRPDAGVRPALKYQPAFDGLRFLGLVSVICVHVAPLQPLVSRFGSYMAVDMFFVISGYLITTLLLQERVANGRLSLRAFYIRRLARLYPLIVVILVIAVVQRLVAPTSSLTPSWLMIAGIAGYFSNFAQLAQPHNIFSAWGPTWSLAIEEQFYLIWPTTLLVLIGRGLRVNRAIVVAGVGVVAIWIARARRWLDVPLDADLFQNLQRAVWSIHYSSFLRPDGLLIGCVTALVLSRPDHRSARALIRFCRYVRWPVIVGLLVIVEQTASAFAGWQAVYGLGLFNVLMALLIVDLVHQPGTLTAKFLGYRPFCWVGARSYFIYAVHYAVFGVTVDVLGLTTLPELVATTLVIFALAGVSYRFYEDPIRQWGYRKSRRLIVSGRTSTTP